MTTPAYWQRRKIRQLWPDHSLRDIAKAVKVGRDTISEWRDAGLLGDLPPRRVRRGKMAPATKARRAERDVPVCQPCHHCEYEDACRVRVSAGLWCLCERPTSARLR